MPKIPVLQSKKTDRLWISNLAERFARVSPDEIDQVIEDSLRTIGKKLKAAHCSLGRFYNDGNENRITHSWRGPAKKTLPKEIFSKKSYPWHVSQLLQGKTVRLDQIDEKNAEAQSDKTSGSRDGIKSMVSIPVFQGPFAVGHFTILSDKKETGWSHSLIEKLQIMANVIGNAFARVRSEKTLEQQLMEQAELRYALYRSSRISTMGGMTAALAHEINQPLAGILNNAQAAQRFLDSPNPSLDEFKEITKDIIRDAKRARDVMLKLRSIFQKSREDFAPVDIIEMIRDLSPLLQSQLLMHQINLKEELDSVSVMVDGDRTQLQQVLINLLFNGIEAMKESGGGQLRLSAHCTAGTITIKVSDSGPGVPVNILPHVFEPFFTTKTGGLGMGLSINKTIITQHGGKIWVENNLDRGASFSFTLPILPPAGDRIPA